MNRNGFSLMEFIIVIVLIAILTAAMLPLVDAQLLKQTLATDTQKIIENSRLARQAAISREDGYSFYGIQFYNGLIVNGTPRVGYKVLRYEPNSIAAPIPANAPTTVLQGPVAGDNSMLLLEENMVLDRRIIFDATSKIGAGAGQQNRVIFTSNGSATTDGQTLLSATGISQNNLIVLSNRNNSNNRTTITIKPVTGSIESQ